MIAAPESVSIVATGAAAGLFALVFLFSAHVHPLRRLVRDRRSIVSFCAGLSAAYVFVHVMPELHLARVAFTKSASLPMPYEGVGLYFMALVGFLAFYGVDHLRGQLRESGDDEAQSRSFRLHIGGFAAYVWLVGYLLVRQIEESATSIALYASAIVFHFIAVEHSLRAEHGDLYQRVGRWVLASMSVLGWAAGVLFALPLAVVAPLLAFLSGSIIMNSLIMELPSEKDGRFLPFMVGGIAYGLILVPLG